MLVTRVYIWWVGPSSQWTEGRESMVVVRVEWLSGRNPKQKEALVAEIIRRLEAHWWRTRRECSYHPARCSAVELGPSRQARRATRGASGQAGREPVSCRVRGVERARCDALAPGYAARSR